MKMRVWVPPWQMELVAHLLAPYGEIEIADFMKLPLKHLDRAKQFEGQPFSYNAAVLDQHTRCRVHMVDYAFNYLLNARPETMEDRSYPTKAPLGPRSTSGWKKGSLQGDDKPYVVFPVGATSDNKLFRASVMGPIMRWCQSNGYEVVITGTKTSHTHTQVDGVLKPIVIREQTDLLPADVAVSIIDVREKTTLLQLRDLLGHAAAVVGVDGGTMHLAGTTDVPIVFASGTTLPKHRYIPRHGSHTFRARYVGPRDLECYGCQSNWPMTTLHFTKCVYGDNACMEQLHPDDFINGLKELGL
jgi:ADP-heptose:LPS heptosyltransferase